MRITQSFDLPLDRESFDLAQDRELVERVVQWQLGVFDSLITRSSCLQRDSPISFPYPGYLLEWARVSRLLFDKAQPLGTRQLRPFQRFAKVAR
jgi:hypothetical protein